MAGVACDRPALGFPLVAGLRPATVERERIKERDGGGRRERVRGLERERAEIMEVLIVLDIFEGLLELVWKFHDTRSICKIRMNHLELPMKFELRFTT